MCDTSGNTDNLFSCGPFAQAEPWWILNRSKMQSDFRVFRRSPLWKCLDSSTNHVIIQSNPPRQVIQLHTIQLHTTGSVHGQSAFFNRSHVIHASASPLFSIQCEANRPQSVLLTSFLNKNFLLLQMSMLVLHRESITFIRRSFFKNPKPPERTRLMMIWSSSFPYERRL